MCRDKLALCGSKLLRYFSVGIVQLCPELLDGLLGSQFSPRRLLLDSLQRPGMLQGC